MGLQFSIGYPWLKIVWLKKTPLAKENFLTMNPFWHDFKGSQLKYSLVKGKFKKKIADNVAPKCRFLGVFVKKNTPLAKDLERKIYHWLGNPPPPHRGLDWDQNTFKGMMYHIVGYLYICGLWTTIFSQSSPLYLYRSTLITAWISN